MAGVKISNLPAIVTPAVTDIFPVVQAGVTYKMTITQLGTLVLLLSGGTMTGNLILAGDPSSALMAATKQYVDNIATGLNVQQSCVAATTGALTVTYNNGASGVGATLTNAGALAAFSIDGQSPTVGQRVLIKDQASTFQNGIYTVTTVGSGAVAWVLTRATDFDTPSEIVPGDFVLVLNGTVNGQTQWVQTATVATVGTDAIIWNQFGADINAVITAIQNNSYVYCEDTGAADAYVATPSPAITSYVEGLLIILDPDNANATTTPTINVSGLGVKTITNNLGGALVAGDIVASQRLYLLYDGTNFRLLNRNYEKRAQNESFNYILDGGSANTYTATLIPAITAYVAGQRVSLKIANSNTGASTLNISGVGAQAIKMVDGSDLLGGELYAGMIADLRYDGTNFQLLNPPRVLNEAKNFIIGGNFDTNPWQRGTSFTDPASNSYTADRFVRIKNNDGAVNYLKTTDAPTVAQSGIFTQFCLHSDVTTADGTIAAGQYELIRQYIEGYNAAEFLQKPFTLSFWVKSTKTGIFCVSFNNSGQDRSYIAEYTINTTDTWEYKTITVPASPSAGTWDYTNGIGLGIDWTIAAGTDFHGTANAWTAQAARFCTVNQVNGLDSDSNNFKLALIQLTQGSQVYPFIPRTLNEELALCQRYFWKSFQQGTTPAQNVGVTGCITWSPAVGAGSPTLPPHVMFPVVMRATPTMTYFNPSAANAQARDISGALDGANTTTYQVSDSGFTIVYDTNAGSIANTASGIHATAAAEL